MTTTVGGLTACECGNNWFHAQVALDDKGEVLVLLLGKCDSCGKSAKDMP